ncbi:MAG: glycosyltransferase [Winogradskyella sp.]|nr:glycosyltransferase [Winogradskyella sp.]
MNLKLSIITVNYNNAEGLKKTVDSVTAQTWKDFEYIIIDGSSTDGSTEVIKANKNIIDRWVSEPDEGVYQAMNKGISMANGEYLLFLNSGDHFYKDDVLEKFHKELKEQDLIYFNLNVVEGKKDFIKEYPEKLSFAYFFKDTLPHPSTFIKKEAFTKTKPYNEDMKIAADWKFFIDAICKYQLTYKKIDATLSTFYIGGMSSDAENRAVKFHEKQNVLNTEYPAFVYDLEEVLENKEIVNNLRQSRIIRTLIKLGLLNKF